MKSDSPRSSFLSKVWHALPKDMAPCKNLNPPVYPGANLDRLWAYGMPLEKQNLLPLWKCWSGRPHGIIRPRLIAVDRHSSPQLMFMTHMFGRRRYIFSPPPELYWTFQKRSLRKLGGRANPGNPATLKTAREHVLSSGWLI